MIATRRPTGEAGWPNLIIEGREKAGKTYGCLRLSADPRVGTTYVIEVGERRADEYLALGDFLIVEHDDSLRAIVEAIHDVIALPPTGGHPNVLVIDSATSLWDLVKRSAENIARSSKAAQRRLAEDPDAEIEVGHQAWNKATDRWWWSWLNALRTWPGIALLTARADEVAKFADGKPVANQTEYRVDIQKGTPFAVDGSVRMRGAKPPLVTAASSLLFTVPDGGLEVTDSEPLAEVVFGLFAAGTEVTLSVPKAKAALIAHARALDLNQAQAVAAATAAWTQHAAAIGGSVDARTIALLTLAVEGEAARLAAESVEGEGPVAVPVDRGTDGRGPAPLAASPSTGRTDEKVAS